MARARFGAVSLLAKAPHHLPPAQQDCLLCIRPHDVSLRPTDDAVNILTGIVRAVVWQGDLHSVTLDVEGHTLRVSCTPLREPPQPGAVAAVHFAAEDATLIPEETIFGG